MLVLEDGYTGAQHTGDPGSVFGTLAKLFKFYPLVSSSVKQMPAYLPPSNFVWVYPLMFVESSM